MMMARASEPRTAYYVLACREWNAAAMASQRGSSLREPWFRQAERGATDSATAAYERARSGG